MKSIRPNRQVSDAGLLPTLKKKKQLRQALPSLKSTRAAQAKEKWPCGKCGKNVSCAEYSIYCVDCKRWVHRTCAKMSVSDIKSWSKWEWHCGCKPQEVNCEVDANDDDRWPGSSSAVLSAKLSVEEKERLQKAYFTVDGPSSYGSVDNLMRRTGISRTKVKHFLSTSDTYTKFRMAHRRKNFTRLKVQSLHIDEIWSVDLAYMDKVAESNNGVVYLFVAVDTLSRKLFVRPMKNKTAKEARNALAAILNDEERKPSKIWIDKGKEFEGEFRSFCNNKNISIYSTMSETKSAFAERNIRSLKSIVYKYMHEKKTNRYIDNLQDFVGVINSRVNRMIGKSPNDVTKTDESYLISLCNTNTAKKPKFQIGDTVRISRKNLVFMKGYKQQFTSEVFCITDIYTVNPPSYGLQDKNREAILGKFYEDELIKYTVQ